MRLAETYTFYSQRAAEERAKASHAENEQQKVVLLEMAEIFENRAEAARLALRDTSEATG